MTQAGSFKDDDWAGFALVSAPRGMTIEESYYFMMTGITPSIGSKPNSELPSSFVPPITSQSNTVQSDTTQSNQDDVGFTEGEALSFLAGYDITAGGAGPKVHDFVESDHVRDKQGRFAEKPDSAIGDKSDTSDVKSYTSMWLDTITGIRALEAAPARVDPIRSKNPTLRWTETFSEPKVSAAQKREQFNALSAYRGAAYSPVNKYYRGQITREQFMSEDSRHMTAPLAPDDVPRLIDSVFETSRLADNIVVFRGSAIERGVFGDRLQGNLTGFAWEEKGYNSTSANPEIAEEFGGGGVIMRIFVPKGTGAIQLSDWETPKGDRDEAELLLERGLRHRVIADHGIIGGTRHLDVEIY